MAIHIEAQNDVQGGFEKKIEESALGMMLDVMQKYQYQYPIKSAVRELVSNGLDALSERDMAKNILSGKNVVSDYFADIEGDIYQDSRFNPSYYDLNYLGDDNKVNVTYHEGEGTEKDYITFNDQGVGLGGKRMEKYFNLGYSTKRLNRNSLGKFGLGNKSPLAIMPYYTMQNVYNGKLFRFNIYSGTINSLIPKFNMETGQLNGVYICETLKDKAGNPVKFYYEETRQLNGISIIIEAKKHHRTSYLDAVRSQLLYFNNVNMVVEKEGGYNETVSYKADIFYEDDQIILSNNTYWSRPHLLINRVNYGFIDFDELEMEHKSGNIGIKVDPEEVSINPSRESILWDDVTKKMVIDKFQGVVATATKFVQEELKENDFIKWLRICYQISSRYQSGNSNTVVSRLANIIDISQVEPSFPGDDFIKFKPTTITKGLQCRHINLIKTRKANTNSIKVEREELKYGIGSEVHLPIILISSKTNVRKDKYILKHLYTDGFVTIRVPEWFDKPEMTTFEIEEALGMPVSYKKSTFENLKGNAEAVWNQLNKSTEKIIYESIIVPDDFKASDQDEDEEIITEEDQAKATVAQLSHEERRKQNGAIIIHAARVVDGFPVYDPKKDSVQWSEWSIFEVPIRSINNWKEEEIYYGNDVDSNMLVFAAFLSRESTKSIFEVRERTNKQTVLTHSQWAYNRKLIYSNASQYNFVEDNTSYNLWNAFRSNTFFGRDDIKIFKTSKSNNKYFSDFKHIREFFLNYKNNVITMSNTLIKWNTARQIKDKLHRIDFLWNFPFNKTREAQATKFREYVQSNFKEVEEHLGKNIQHITRPAFDSMLKHLDKVQQFQMFVNSCDDSEKIAELATELWSNPSVTDGQAIDLELWKEFEELLDWASPIQLLNELPVLTGRDSSERSDSIDFKLFEERYEYTLYPEIEEEINSYLVLKSVS